MKLLDHLLEPQVLVGLIILLCLGLAIHLVINSNNPLRWWHFISSKGKDGTEYADIDKLGKVTGIVVGSYVVMISKCDSNVLFIYLAYVGAVGGWGAYLRSRDGGKLPPQPTSP